MANKLEMRVRTDRTRSSDDGETVCTVLAGTCGTVTGTRATKLRDGSKDRVLVLTIYWDAALLNPYEDEPQGDCVTENWEEENVPAGAVTFVELTTTGGGSDGE